jgi:pimeloyl-ACP methyl ester carboxylesterase
MTIRPGPTLRHIPVNGITLAVHHWAAATPGEGSPRPLVFAHATGFHARVWDTVIAQFPQAEVYAIDLRGHGQSGGGAFPDWQVPASDVTGALDVLGIAGALGIGHSLGAHLLLQCAADRPNAFARLVLFDPVILPPELYEAAPAHPSGERHPTARRKREFASLDEMFARFSGREPYSLFDPRVYADYCRHGLVPAPGGSGFTLACAPETEASVYETSLSNAGIHAAARQVTIPVLVVRAPHTGPGDFKSSPTWPGLAGIMPRGEDCYRPDRTHFHPLEDPEDAARIIAAALAA